VGTTPRDERTSSDLPTSSSSRAICWLSAGWAMKIWREALARLPLSTICTKYRNCRMSMVDLALL